MKRVVITGGTGLIGSHLSELLAGEGFEVVHLTRAVRPGGKYKSYRWDPQNGYCDSEAIMEGDALIHLAGANIGEKRWNNDRKSKIISSRTVTADLLYHVSAGRGIMPSVFITASGVNIYGSQITQKIYSESDPPADDFLGETCRLWEAAAEPFAEAGIRVVKIRTAVVLASRASALSKMTFPAAAGLIVRFGPGSQYLPWIHIDDLCRIYLRAVTDSVMAGPYNAAAPDHITHDMLMREVARQKRLPVFLPHVPAGLLKAILGEMSVVLTGGSRISSGRLVNSGFGFKFADIASALRDCLQ